MSCSHPDYAQDRRIDRNDKWEPIFIHTISGTAVSRSCIRKKIQKVNPALTLSQPNSNSPYPNHKAVILRKVFLHWLVKAVDRKYLESKAIARADEQELLQLR